MVLLNHTNTKLVSNNVLAIIVDKKEEFDNEYTKVQRIELIYINEIPEKTTLQTI